MGQTLDSLRNAVLTRLGDPGSAIWTTAAVDAHLVQAYQQIAQLQRVFWDWTYLENLPPTFSYTAPWEAVYVTFDAGCANYTYPDERRLLTEASRIGPANSTSPFEATDGWLTAAHASTAISPTSTVPATVTGAARATWDRRGIDWVVPRDMARIDPRYESTTGEVYALLWQKDGLRVIRKVRVPAQQADTCTVNGSWGSLRRPTDLSTDTVSGSWGVARRIPNEQPIGPGTFGLPRRPYRDGKNVRLEHWRHGAAMTSPLDVCELPNRYALYLRDYAQARCLAETGPGQDLKLSQHYDARWTRGLARITRRTETIARQRAGVFGQTGASLGERPARPVLPWAYGSVVR